MGYTKQALFGITGMLAGAASLSLALSSLFSIHSPVNAEETAINRIASPGHLD